MKNFKFFLVICLVITFSGNKCNNSDSECNKITPPNQDCFIGDARLEGGPDSVSSGGTVKIKVTMGAANRQPQFLPTTVNVKVYNSLGQLVTASSTTYPPNSNIQDIPIWQNVTAAAAQYSLVITIDIGPCGSKTFCKTVAVV